MSGRTAMISEGIKAGGSSEQITKYTTVAHFSDFFLNTFSLLGPLTHFYILQLNFRVHVNAVLKSLQYSNKIQITQFRSP